MGFDIYLAGLPHHARPGGMAALRYQRRASTASPSPRRRCTLHSGDFYFAPFHRDIDVLAGLTSWPRPLGRAMLRWQAQATAIIRRSMLLARRRSFLARRHPGAGIVDHRRDATHHRRAAFITRISSLSDEYAGKTLHAEAGEYRHDADRRRIVGAEDLPVGRSRGAAATRIRRRQARAAT